MAKSWRAKLALLSSMVASKNISSFSGKIFDKYSGRQNNTEIIRLRASFKRIVRRYLRVSLEKFEQRFVPFDMESADFQLNLQELFRFIDNTVFKKRLSPFE